MLDYQYYVMFVSMVVGFALVGANRLFETHWFLSRALLLFAIVAFSPAVVVILAHLRKDWFGGFWWEKSNRLWTARRLPKAEKIEVTILSVLWFLILLLVVYAVFQS